MTVTVGVVGNRRAVPTQGITGGGRGSYSLRLLPRSTRGDDHRWLLGVSSAGGL